MQIDANKADWIFFGSDHDLFMNDELSFFMSFKWFALLTKDNHACVLRIPKPTQPAPWTNRHTQCNALWDSQIVRGGSKQGVLSTIQHVPYHSFIF